MPGLEPSPEVKRILENRRAEYIKSLEKRIEQLEAKPVKCCFCDSVYGAMIRLYQGWSCTKCFKKILVPEVNEKEGKE